MVLVPRVVIMKSMSGKNRGFTLMELLIVVAIMLILATVGLTNYIFSLKKSHDVARKSDLATIAKGLEAFANDWGDYPEAAADVSGKIRACGDPAAVGGLSDCEWGGEMTAKFNSVNQTYLVKIPQDPASNQTYFYEKTTGAYKLYAALENMSDPYYHSTGISVLCGTGVTCNYQVSQAGVQ